jgi:type II restriction/modification system DNA methylase subunit YeeA
MQIDGNAFDAGFAPARKRLVLRAEQLGFAALVEQVAYTWFNRLCAIRFMELKPDYLEHGFRVLSPSPSQGEGRGEGIIPEILDHAQDVAEALGLERNHIVELKLAGNKDEALYRELLLGQCHQLHQAMPFLFEALDDETELLLPDNLTRTDSILRGLVDGIPEEDWEQVEIIGWLYQFYISEKKDQVIGKVVKSEDIPAATQLFTPNWIVKYLVQNSIGRQWLMTYPESSLKAQMEYYIAPAEQEASVTAALAAITPTSIEPETIKVIDPACGSGHILVEAYNLLKAIYEERGYRSRDIPKLILENNLFGLDIDDRAAQLAGFALMMKAREDDRRIFTRDIKLNVLALQSSKDLDLPYLWRRLDVNNVLSLGANESLFDDDQSHLVDVLNDADFKTLQSVIDLFEHAKTFGSLIQVPADKAGFLKDLKKQLQTLIEQGNSFQKPAAKTLLPFVQQAQILAMKFDAVIANPPYMGSKGMNSELKVFAKKHFPDSKSDLFAMFMERWVIDNSDQYIAMVTMQSWMFLSSYEQLRKYLLSVSTIESMAHLGPGGFDGLSKNIVQTTCFILRKNKLTNYNSVFDRLVEYDGSENKKTSFLLKKNRFIGVNHNDFKKISGSPIVYWVSDAIINTFEKTTKMDDLCHSFQGIITGNNEFFLRYWYELKNKSIAWEFTNYKEAESIVTWVPYNKGGGYRKWYGNNEYVLRWNGYGDNLIRGRTENRSYFFDLGLTWSDITGPIASFRLQPKGLLFDAKGPSAFYSNNEQHIYAIGLMNSVFVQYIKPILNPTLSFQIEDFNKVPIENSIFKNIHLLGLINRCISITKDDWDTFETSWDFKDSILLRNAVRQSTIKATYTKIRSSWHESTLIVQRLEEENNLIFIEAYDLQEELISDVPLSEITLTNNPKYRYGSNLFDEELAQRFQSDTLAELISYAIGCMMGRYRIDKPGLIYANSGNIDFDKIYNNDNANPFTPDDDGIIPLTDQDWFKDDATNRFRDFVRTVWGEESLQENLAFVAESLCLGSLTAKRGEQSLETIRRYLSNQFYKDHLKTYKKRPIYWLFSSGKQKAFEGLVYLHRYNDSTLPRMRTEYVTPLLGKYDAYADQLKKQLEDATTSEATQLKKELLALEKKQTELRAFDDNLKHYADRRIKLDLDDGVKVNYGKFGDLLAEVKAITGGKGD